MLFGADTSLTHGNKLKKIMYVHNTEKWGALGPTSTVFFYSLLILV